MPLIRSFSVASIPPCNVTWSDGQPMHAPRNRIETTPFVSTSTSSISPPSACMEGRICSMRSDTSLNRRLLGWLLFGDILLNNTRKSISLQAPVHCAYETPYLSFNPHTFPDSLWWSNDDEPKFHNPWAWSPIFCSHTSDDFTWCTGWYWEQELPRNSSENVVGSGIHKWGKDGSVESIVGIRFSEHHENNTSATSTVK